MIVHSVVIGTKGLYVVYKGPEKNACSVVSQMNVRAIKGTNMMWPFYFLH